MTRSAARWTVLIALSLSALCFSDAGRSMAAFSQSHAYAWRVLVSAGSQPLLSHPEGVAIDPRGRSSQKWMYVIDTGHDRIIKLGTGGRILGTWGSRGSSTVRFQQLTGIAVDGQGNVYVADAGNNRIKKFGAQGQLLSQWGTAGTGPGQFDDPAGVAVGGSGNVFVADRANKRIQKFSPTGRLLAVWPVTSPSSSNPTGFGPAGPYALAVDRRGDVYTAVDTGQCSGGHCVMDYDALETYSPSGTIIRTLVGGNPYGPFQYGGSVKVGPWWQIGAMAIDSRDHLFLAEWNPQDRASITELSSNAKIIGQWELPKPSGASGWPPKGMALDPHGNVYVADSLANRLLKLTFQP